LHLGGTGHSGAILDKMMPEGFLVGIDQDKDAIDNAKKVLSSYAPKLLFFMIILSISSLFFLSLISIKWMASLLIWEFHFIN
jgi:hypothetical protein